MSTAASLGLFHVGRDCSQRRGGLSRPAAAAALSLLFLLPAAAEECAAPQPVCAARASVFRVASFDPYGSAVRIGPDLLVTNRHVVADETEIKVTLPDGEEIKGEVVPSSWQGDLILVRARLPDGPAMKPGGAAEGALFTVGLDLSSRAVKVFPEGHVLKQPDAAKPYARLHHTAYSQPGTSGGAVVNAKGELVAVAASGGAGRFEAVPAVQIAALEAASGPEHAGESAAIGKAVRECTLVLEKIQRSRDALPREIAAEMSESCTASHNRQLFDLAAQALGRSRMFDESVAFFERALEKDPNAINSRVGLVITYAFARRHKEALPHVKWLVDAVPESIEVQRFAVHVGKNAGDLELSKRGLALIKKHNPAQYEAAKRFLESDGRPPERH